MTLKDVVFTAMFGDYETLNYVDVAKNSACEFICFTDNPNLKSETWQVVQTAPRIPGDNIRSSRAIKMLGHQRFPRGTRSLYVDNSVKLIVDPTKILDDWLVNRPLAFMGHSSRETVRGEFFICSAYGLDDPNKIYEQYRYYRDTVPQVLGQRPFWGGMIARESNESVDIFMEEWFAQYMRFSRRDQLAINATAAITGIEICRIEGRNDLSWSHAWPLATNRKVESRDTVGNSIFRKPKIILNGLHYAPRYYLGR